MKQSKTLSLAEAIRSLWDEDPEMHEQLLVYRLRQLLPELIGPAYRWIIDVQFEEETLYLRTSSTSIAQDLRLRQLELCRAINDRLHIELVRSLHIYI